MRPRRLLAAAALGAALAACGGDGPDPGPEPGYLEVVVLGPATNTGALLFDVAGGTVDSVVAEGAYLISASHAGVARRIAVAGDSLHGTVARLYVPDVHQHYVATLVEAAHGATHQLLLPADYRLPLLAHAQ